MSYAAAWSASFNFLFFLFQCLSSWEMIIYKSRNVYVYKWEKFQKKKNNFLLEDLLEVEWDTTQLVNFTLIKKESTIVSKETNNQFKVNSIYQREESSYL